MSWTPPPPPEDQDPHGRPGGQPPHGPGFDPYGGQGGYQPGGFRQGGFGGPPVSPSEERTWGMLAHLGSLIAICVLTFFNFVVPLVIYLMYRDRSAFVRHNAAQALNLTLTGLVYGAIGGVVTIITCGVGIVLLLALFVAQIVFLIMAATAANRGEWYRYPQWIAYPLFT
ncbi:DUF4870 domain-containing protein [Actinocorallia longicatena]|uniref:DUF4870 domain-containing protein n=1 Tax=Actinocorallia longicatena TaxID=111803 RepID=A0ABP6QN40_9ACTN